MTDRCFHMLLKAQCDRKQPGLAWSARANWSAQTGCKHPHPSEIQTSTSRGILLLARNFKFRCFIIGGVSKPRPHCSQEPRTSSKVRGRSLVSLMPCYVISPPPHHMTPRGAQTAISSNKKFCTKTFVLTGLGDSRREMLTFWQELASASNAATVKLELLLPSSGHERFFRFNFLIVHH